MNSNIEIEVERLKAENERYRKVLTRLFEVAIEIGLEESYPLAVDEARTALEEGDI